MLEAKYAVIEEIRQYIIENKLHFDAKEVITNYDITNSYNVLENLYDDKYINKPNYFILEHDQFDEKKYEIRCSVEGYNFYSVKIHSDKEVAKNLAAYSMLEMIVLQSN